MPRLAIRSSPLHQEQLNIHHRFPHLEVLVAVVSSAVVAVAVVAVAAGVMSSSVVAVVAVATSLMTSLMVAAGVALVADKRSLQN